MSTPGCPTLGTAPTVRHPVTAANKEPARNPGRFRLPREIAEAPELMELMLPAVRRALDLSETHNFGRRRPSVTMRCKSSRFRGSRDPGRG